MSLAASAKPLARERLSSENFLKALQQAELATKEAAPVWGDYSFVEPKTTSEHGSDFGIRADAQAFCH